jgi:hypothetical protein
VAGPSPGDRLQPFALNGPNGKMAAWKPGRVTVLCFCTFWCDTWKEQSKRLSAASRSLSGLPVDFLTVSADGRWSERGEGRVAGTLLLDSGGALRKRLGINRIPCTMVVDAGGRVIYASQGIVRSEAVVNAARQCLAAVPGEQGAAVYLTFDDFPSRDLDDRLLDVLRAQRVPATFFCICSRAGEYAEVCRRAVREGHSLQIHSWDHRADDPKLDQCLSVLAGVTGARGEL